MAYVSSTKANKPDINEEMMPRLRFIWMVLVCVSYFVRMMPKAHPTVAIKIRAVSAVLIRMLASI